jgi:glucose-6-phosphate 1-epimerase
MPDDERTLGALNERFAIPGAARFEAGSGGLIRAVVTGSAAEGHVYLHGAHVTHHRPAGHAPLLFLSERSQFAPGRAIRGGVPIIFPWFGARAGDPKAPDHGFARNRSWALESVARDIDGSVAVTLTLEPDDSTRQAWPHDFRARHHVVFGERLRLSLEVENRSRQAFTFEEALHTYLLVGDVRRASVAGLGGATYIDKTDGMKRKVLTSEPLVLTGATDRVFLATRATCTVTDAALARRLVIEKSGSATTVVWNPWSEKAAAMTDLGADAWPSMLCVEAANAADNAISLAGGARHTMTVVIGAVSV